MFAPGAPLHRPRRPTVILCAIAAFVAVLMVLPVGSTLGGVGGSTSHVAVTAPHPAERTAPLDLVANGSAYNWPEIHLNQQLTGYDKNTTLSTTNASQLGVRWAAELYGQAIDSPSVAYNPALGETLVYIGTEPGYLLALNLQTAQIVWSIWLGSPVVSSPVINNGSLYVATQRNTAVFNINATTGAVECSVPIPFEIQSTGVIATPPGGVRTFYIGSENTGVNGPLYAINAANCSIEWSYADYSIITGNWDPVSYVVLQNGTPAVFVGTANPDSAVYEFNALTGQLLWRYMTSFPPGGNFDIGAGITISAPGVNGFKYGVAYGINKYGALVALNLSSGKLIWGYNINNLTGGKPPSRSTFALAGDNLVFGHQEGVLDVNAKTGALIWQWNDSTDTEVLSSPAIVGPTLATAIVVAADLAGTVFALSLASGGLLYSYQTGNYITASPAVSNGNILIDSTDSLLYDFQVGGGNDVALPTTTISSPTYNEKLSNPNGHITIHGNATDPKGVASVGLGIEAGETGAAWWDGTTDTWVAGPYTNFATLASPGATSSAWSYQIPVPVGGAAYMATANAISISGQTDNVGAFVEFSVLASTTAPHLKANPVTVAPGGVTTVSGGAFGKNELVTIRYLNVTLATEHASSTGYLPDIKVTVPTSASFGLSALVATGSSTGKTATAAVEVLNDWDSVGYNATQTGSEPWDPTFYNLIAVGTGNFVHLSWNFVAGAPINASPVVANDVVYVAATNGYVYALDVHNGGLLWTAWPSGGSPLLQSAVDPSTGLVYVTAGNGSVYALATTTGATVWSTDIGGILTAPEIGADGLYVASTTGALDLLNPSTGAVKWSDGLASKVTAAPAISQTGKELVIGEWNGDLVAFNAATGKTEWSYATTGAIKAAATIYNGSIFVGSDNDYVYSLTYNGKLNWEYLTSAPVEDTGALTFVTSVAPPAGGIPLIVIGDNAGVTYALRATDGHLWFTQTDGGAVNGVSAVQGMIVIQRAGGDVDGVRNYADYGLFNVQLGAYSTSTPVIVNGAIYLTSGTGALYVYTGNGEPPV